MLETISMFFETLTQHQDVPLFILRLFVGLIFVNESRVKLKNVPKFAKSDGLPVPVAWVLTFAELAGGLALIFGVLTQLAAAGLMLLMIGSMSFHIFKWHSPFWASKGGWEYDLMLFLMAMAIVFTGGGDIGLYPFLLG